MKWCRRRHWLWLGFVTVAFLLASCQEDETATATAPPASPDTDPNVAATVAATPRATVTAEQAGNRRGEGNADVTFVRAVQAEDGNWTFYVTVEHPDTGWEDYADGWDVLTPDGTVIKKDPDDTFTRRLLHPHVGEQPFTRSQSGLVIAEGITQVTVRAHDLVSGYGGQEVLVDLTASSGPGFTVVEG